MNLIFSKYLKQHCYMHLLKLFLEAWCFLFCFFPSPHGVWNLKKSLSFITLMDETTTYRYYFFPNLSSYDNLLFQVWLFAIEYLPLFAFSCIVLKLAFSSSSSSLNFARLLGLSLHFYLLADTHYL